MSLHCCKPAQTIGMLITDNKRLCGGNSLFLPLSYKQALGKLFMHIDQQSRDGRFAMSRSEIM